MTNTLQIDTDNGHFGGYLALPADGENGKGVIIAQEIFGVNAFLRDIADSMARDGFIAFVPDLFWRIEPNIELSDKSEADMKRAFKLFGLFDIACGISDIQLSIDALRKHLNCNGNVGVMGFCLGGKLAMLSAAHTDTNAAVSYYGVGHESALD